MITSSPTISSCLFSTRLLVIVNKGESQSITAVLRGCSNAWKSFTIDSKAGKF